MKHMRMITALVGLACLFACAWCGYYGAEQWEKSEQQWNCDEESEEAFMYQQEMPANEGFLGKSENKTRVIQTTVKPKIRIYRNLSRDLVISEDDYNVLLRIVEAEATGGTITSKKMVANVVLNRVADSHFPDSVAEVVFQSGSDQTAQFSPIKDGRFYKVKVSKGTKRAVKAVLDGKDETGGALFFMNRKTASAKNVAWFDGKLRYLFDCGGHSYYAYRDNT